MYYVTINTQNLDLTINQESILCVSRQDKVITIDYLYQDESNRLEFESTSEAIDITTLIQKQMQHNAERHNGEW